MIHDYKVPELIAERLPEIKSDLGWLQTQGDVVYSVQVLASYSKRKLIEKDFKLVEKCFQVAEKLFLRGDKPVKKAIVNYFVISFPAMLLACNKKGESSKLRECITPTLYALYLKQIQIQTANQ